MEDKRAEELLEQPSENPTGSERKKSREPGNETKLNAKNSPAKHWKPTALYWKQWVSKNYSTTTWMFQITGEKR